MQIIGSHKYEKCLHFLKNLFLGKLWFDILFELFVINYSLYHSLLRVWEYGGYASKGLEQVAKWGSPRALESELKSQSLHIRTIIKARGLWFPNHNGKTFAVFRTDRKNHLVSLVKFFLCYLTRILEIEIRNVINQNNLLIQYLFPFLYTRFLCLDHHQIGLLVCLA